MKKERMMILQLLAEGAIDTDEAVQLLEALGHKDNIEKSADCENTWEDIDEFLEMVEDEVISPKEAVKLIKSMKTGKDMEDFSERFHAAYKHVEPELDAAAKEVLGAVATLLDDVSQSLKGKNNEPC